MPQDQPPERIVIKGHKITGNGRKIEVNNNDKATITNTETGLSAVFNSLDELPQTIDNDTVAKHQPQATAVNTPEKPPQTPFQRILKILTHKF
ncbi:MAG: hypothetical protein ACOYK8_05210 [Alphaproteobacteria bacterium]